VATSSFGLFLRMLQTNNDVNILSRPDILILNNQEGEISVGEVLPFPRKRGMLEAIHRSVSELEQDEATMRRIRQRDLEDESSPIQVAR
jgi:type II secretory pathway component GspD/PulD (secretin)